MHTAKCDDNVNDLDVETLLISVDRSHGEVKALAEALERQYQINQGVKRWVQQMKTDLN